MLAHVSVHGTTAYLTDAVIESIFEKAESLGGY